MIDTVHFRINNLTRNKNIVSQLATISKYGNTEILVESSLLEAMEASKVRAILYHDYDNIMPISRRAHLHIPSSHYSISYLVNHDRDFIEFNLSLPKYFYSTNVLQYINYYDTEYQATYYSLISFFDHFFKRFIITTPDFSDVEIRRIDLCYNQFFIDKSSALSYLEKQKALLAKHARSSKNNYRNYQTSLFYVTGRYSFKIYHKGTEFKAHDLKELYKSNPLEFDFDFLTYHADRILRYEMTIRNSYLNYILKQDILKTSAESNYKSYFSYMRRFFNSREINKEMDLFLGKSLKFTLKSSWDEFRTDTNSIEKYRNNYNVSFNSELFKHVYNRFWKKVLDYQLDVKLSIHDVMKRIDEHHSINNAKNSLRKKQKSNEGKSRMITLALLSQFMDLGNLKNIIPTSTLTRYKSQLKKMGINMYNSNDSIPSPPLNYQEYKYYFGRFHDRKIN